MKNQEQLENIVVGHHRHEAHKRKWLYTEPPTSYPNYTIDNKSVVANKKSMIAYDYENYQPNHQFSPPTNGHNGHQSPMAGDVTTNCNQNQSPDINTMEIGENIEYVNILYDDSLLSGVPAASVTDPNYINFEPNWNNADILDLDQRNYYYETATTIASCVEHTSNDLNGQLLSQHEQHPQHHHHHQQQQQHQQAHHIQLESAQLDQSHEQQELTNVSQTYDDMVPNTIYVGISNVGERSSAISTSVASLVAPTDDTEDKNLSWLYNFKLNELPHLSPEVNRTRTETGLQVDKIIQEATSSETDEPNQTAQDGNGNGLESKAKIPKKPPFTYTELIEYALEDKGELTVSGIYNWISDRFPFYKSNDDRWKNSVRHNLSINPHFRKGNKAPQGAGHLWIISTRDSEANLLAWEHKKQRLELFFKMEKTFGQTSEPFDDVPLTTVAVAQDETSVAVANLTNLLDHSESPEPNSNAEKIESSSSYPNQNVATVADHRINSDDELKKSAGEILNGVKRTVEVQMINSPNTLNFHEPSILEYFEDFPDYLNPVPKDQIVRECGLRSSQRQNQNEFGNDYFVSELDPIELGINMSSNSVDTDEGLFGDEFNLNYFGIVPGNNIMA